MIYGDKNERAEYVKRRRKFVNYRSRAGTKKKTDMFYPWNIHRKDGQYLLQTGRLERRAT
jgi:hypothetical protein